MKVKVTKEDIRLGKQRDEEACAIARAVKRAIKKHKYHKCLNGIKLDVNSVSVDGNGYIDVEYLDSYSDNVTVNNFDVRLLCGVSKITNFINAWDQNRKSVKPFSFDLQIEADIDVVDSKKIRC